MTTREGISERRRRRQRKRRLMIRQKSVRRFPKEILEEILHRLPLNSLSRCKDICKEWNSIISDPNFAIEDYRRRPADNTHMIISTRERHRSGYFCHTELQHIYALNFSDSRTLSTRSSCCKDADHWLDSLNPTILVSYNGLVAVACGHDKYVLWNPLTRHYKSFYRESYDFSARHILYGLCYDHSSHEYSIVVTTEYQSQPTSPTSFDQEIGYEGSTSVLTNLSTGARKSIYSSALLELRLLEKRQFHGGMGKVICGYPHWLLSFYYFENPVLQREIIYFDLKDELYKQLERPREAIGAAKTMVGLADLEDVDGQLGMVVHDTQSSSLEVWVMKEYGNIESWSNMFVISTLVFNNFVPKFNFMDLLGYLPTGEILIDVNLKDFLAYDVANGKARQIHLGFPTPIRSEYVTITRYYPSVVSPLGLVSIKRKKRKRKTLS